MFRIVRLAFISTVICFLMLLLELPRPLPAGQLPLYKVLPGITEGALTIFPVITPSTHDTSGFLTLDEGMRSGEVEVTEIGSLGPGLMRPPRHRGGPDPGFVLPLPRDWAEVNRLILVNRSTRPLLLLAGEIVAGGKQDRVVARDRIVPAHSDSIDLSVFCVEPHRWQQGAAFASEGAPIVQPSVRSKVMIDRDQGSVWASVGFVRAKMMAAAPAAAAAELGATSSYATVMANDAVQQRLRELEKPIENSYSKMEAQLRDRQAVGVVAAVNGRILWADIFASSELLHAYWPKLVSSYAAEALNTVGRLRSPDVRAAQDFLDNWNGCGQTAEKKEDVYRLSKIEGDDFTAFRLTSLLPKTGFDVHVAKIGEVESVACAR